VLHPRYKGTYFIKAKWDIEWIDTANEMLRKEWEEVYKPTIDPSFLKSAAEAAPKDPVCISSAFGICVNVLFYEDYDDLFAEIDSFGKNTSEDVLDAYLNAPPDADTDPIKFWVSRLDKPGEKVSPRGALARMGLDFLTAPGKPFIYLVHFIYSLTYTIATSTDVERLFSHGGTQVTKRRHNLSFETLRCLMILRSWFEAGLVPIDEVLEYFRTLRSRRKGNNDDGDDEDD